MEQGCRLDEEEWGLNNHVDQNAPQLNRTEDDRKQEHPDQSVDDVGLNSLDNLHASSCAVMANDRVERPATLPLAACRASQQPVGSQGAAHDSPRSAPTRC